MIDLLLMRQSFWKTRFNVGHYYSDRVRYYSSLYFFIFCIQYCKTNSSCFAFDPFQTTVKYAILAPMLTANQTLFNNGQCKTT